MGVLLDGSRLGECDANDFLLGLFGGGGTTFLWWWWWLRVRTRGDVGVRLFLERLFGLDRFLVWELAGRVVDGDAALY